MKKEKRTYQHGLWGEAAACWYLRLKGYSILVQRYKTNVGEVDIIARRGGVIAMVEVKTRRQHTGEVLSQHQQRRICNAARQFQSHYPHLADCTYRFDLLMMQPWRWPVHIHHAWEA